MELKRYKLGEILELQRGYDLPSSQQKAGNVLVAGSNGIIGYHNEIRGNHPCITVGRSGSVGKVHYYEQPTWAHNTALFVKDFKGNNPQYLYYFLKNLHLDEMFVKGSSVVPSLDRKVVHSLVVPFHKEVVCQKRIALVLSNIDRKIELNRAINKKLEATGYGWIKESDVPKSHSTIPLHKIYIPKSGGSGTDAIVLGSPFYGEPNSVCSYTYLVIGYNAETHNFSQEECYNIIRYIKSRFFRYMVSIKKKTQDNPRDVFQFVPLQDFSKPWTDKELYGKYELDLFEREYIESLIKPME